MRGDPIEALFGQYRREILGLLLNRPHESFHTRELERLTGVPVGSLARELGNLVDGGILRREQRGNRVFHEVNRDCPVLEQLVALFGASYGRPVSDTDAVSDASGGEYRARSSLKFSQPALARLCRRHHVRRLSLFGSMARGDAGPESDVDVLVEFETDKAPGMYHLQDLQQELSRLFQGREVDVATPAVLENPYRRKTILKDMEVLYENPGKGHGIPVGHAPGMS